MTATALSDALTGRSTAATQNWRILIIDDEPGIRRSLCAYLEEQGYPVDAAADAFEAREFLQATQYDLVLSDIAMPKISGLDLLPEVRAKNPNTEVIMITAYLDISLAIEAMRKGAYDFFTKPFNFDKVLLTIERLKERRELETRARAYEILKSQKDFERKTILETVLGLARAVEERDKENVGHGKRTAEFSLLLGRRLGFTEERLERLRYMGLLHDVGKIGIDDRILNKPARLTPEEFEQVQRHPEIGQYILTPMTFLHDVAPGVRHHHENWDGSGYPDGLVGEDIPLDARILGIADFFDSITSLRQYRSPMPTEDALALVLQETGRKFDPVLGPLFVELVRESLGCEFTEVA